MSDFWAGVVIVALVWVNAAIVARVAYLEGVRVGRIRELERRIGEANDA